MTRRKSPHLSKNPRTVLLSSPSDTLSSSSFKRKATKSSKTKNQKKRKTKFDGTIAKSSPRFLAARALMPIFQNDAKDKQPSQSVLTSSCVARLESMKEFRDDLSTRDRAFCRLLVTTTERRVGQVDKVLATVSNKGNNKKKTGVTTGNTKKKVPRHRWLEQEWLTAVLRLGIVQLLFLSVPSHAAVKETIDLLRMNGGITVPEARIKYANAVLRRISRNNCSEGLQLLNNSTDEADNVVPWLLQQWQKQWGEERTRQIIHQAMMQSPTTLTVKQLQGGEEWRQHVRLKQEQHDQRIMAVANQLLAAGAEIEVLPQGSLRIVRSPNVSLAVEDSDPGVGDNNSSHTMLDNRGSGSTVSTWPGYERPGDWWAQDPSATVPAIAVYKGLLMEQQAEELQSCHVVEMCAAPGGKTAQLCCNYADLIGKVTAVEVSARRCRRLMENMHRLDICTSIEGVNSSTDMATKNTARKSGLDDVNITADVTGYSAGCHVVVGDGTTWIPPDDCSVSAVLLDAPCTATGTASKRPDVLRRSDDFQDLLDIQYALACHATDHILKPGGILVYAVCSLLKQEGEDQIKKLLSRGHLPRQQNGTSHSILETIPFQLGEIPGFDNTIDKDSGWLRILPGTLPGSLKQCDGFFVARLRRIE